MCSTEEEKLEWAGIRRINNSGLDMLMSKCLLDILVTMLHKQFDIEQVGKKSELIGFYSISIAQDALWL